MTGEDSIESVKFWLADMQTQICRARSFLYAPNDEIIKQEAMAALVQMEIAVERLKHEIQRYGKDSKKQ